MAEQSRPVLDDVARMQSVDRRNMLRLINELPEQCETALGVGRSVTFEPSETKPNVVLITGVGDSAIAAEMVVSAMDDLIDIPIICDHGGEMPKYIGEDSVVIAVDYSGSSNTTLRSYNDAKARGAEVICVATRGKLLETASNDGVKIVKIPPGQPSRTAIGYLFVPIVAVLEQRGLVTGATEKLSHAIKLLKNVREALRFETPTARNRAKQAAEELAEKLVVVLGAPGYVSIVAERWKTQISANSKSPVMAGRFPDFGDGMISAWESTREYANRIAFVFLKDAADKTEVAEIMEAAKVVLSDYDVIDVEMKGASIMEKMLYGTYFGDYLSYYLALLYEVDPTPTKYVSNLQAVLAGEEIEE